MSGNNCIRDDILDFFRSIRNFLPQYDAATRAVLNERWDTVWRQLTQIAERPDHFYLLENDATRAQALADRLRTQLGTERRTTT